MKRTMALSLPVFSYTPIRHTLYKYKFIKDKHTKAKAFNLTFKYIDDVLSIQTVLTGFH